MISGENNKLTENKLKSSPIKPIKPNDHKAARRRVIIGLSAAIFLIALIPLVYLGASMLGAFGARDIGGSYSQEDLQRAKAKLNLTFTDGNTDYDNIFSLAAAAAGEDLDNDYSYEDFDWTYDDYSLVKVELSAAELQALLNEASPAAFWIEDLQVSSDKNRSIELSGLLRLERLLDELYVQERAELPISGFEKISFYLKTDISIYENQLELNTEKLHIGPVQLIKNEVMNHNAVYLERIYRVVPELTIHSLEIISNGRFRITMTIPHKVSAARKNGD